MNSALLLTRLFAQTNEISRTTARYCGLTPQLARAVLLIVECKPCYVKKLTELMNVHSTAMSKILSRLSQLGMVVRSLDTHDRRIEHVELTLLGLQSAARYKEQLEKIAHAVTMKHRIKNDSTQVNDIDRMQHIVTIFSHLQKIGGSK